MRPVDDGAVRRGGTPAALRRTGAGRALLHHLIGVARARGYRTLHLETGRHPAFEPAHALYRSAGFQSCGPFGDYLDNGHSVFMALALQTPPG